MQQYPSQYNIVCLKLNSPPCKNTVSYTQNITLSITYHYLPNNSHCAITNQYTSRFSPFSATLHRLHNPPLVSNAFARRQRSHVARPFHAASTTWPAGIRRRKLHRFKPTITTDVFHGLLYDFRHRNMEQQASLWPQRKLTRLGVEWGSP